MNLSIGPEHDQQQKMALSPVSLQSLEILQMPVLDLQRTIEHELEENPFLEIQPMDDFHDVNNTTDQEEKDEFWISYKNTENSMNDNYLKSEAENYDKNNTFDLIIKRKTLKEHLLEQSGTLKESSLIIGICNYIIENIDERGYLCSDVKEIARDLNVEERLVIKALNVVQKFQPSGVGARNLRECLRIQLHNRHISDENVYRIIDNYLDLLAENKLKEIAKCLEVSIHKLQEYLKIIRSLEPKPSRGFYTGGFENIVIPEAYVKKAGAELYVFPNSSVLPNISINNDYVDLMRQKSDSIAEGFLKEKYERALFLVKGIADRNKTIFRIIEKLVELQRDYFLYGESHLKPMTIGDIAAELRIHESTISRAIKDKYISAPFNTVKIKDLFSTGIRTRTENETVSSNVIKNEIKKLIEDEDKNSPLSDQNICDILKNNNFEISRRTIAKYREELGIGPSSKRKEYF